jgi:hypothetical protein
MSLLPPCQRGNAHLPSPRGCRCASPILPSCAPWSPRSRRTVSASSRWSLCSCPRKPRCQNRPRSSGGPEAGRAANLDDPARPRGSRAGSGRSGSRQWQRQRRRGPAAEPAAAPAPPRGGRESSRQAAFLGRSRKDAAEAALAPCCSRIRNRRARRTTGSPRSDVAVGHRSQGDPTDFGDAA